MKIALIGFGKMGHMIEHLALQQGHSIVAKINSSQWDNKSLQQADICMDFTRPECVVDNINKLADLRKNVIIGTTGWYDKLELVESIVNTKKIGAVYSPNFSIGVNLLLQILDHASKVMNAFDEYDVAGIEYHHNQKKDAPSGTALEMARTIEKNMDRIDQLPFSSIRCGSIPGTHTILFDSMCDSITISHQARNREGFAQGALQAAEWVQGKKGLYTFADCLQDIIQKRLVCI